MKKLAITLLCLMLLSALTAPALAMGTKDMYVTKDGVKVYAEPDKHSEVIGRVYKGELIRFIDRSEDGKWYGTYDGGDMGWIQKKYLSADEPCDHQWSKWTIERKATCTRTGLRTRYCKLCGQEQEETIKKTGHDFGKWRINRQATCTREGERVRYCQVCDYKETQVIEKTPHEFGPWTVTLRATDHSAGRRTHTCENCGTQQSEDFDPEGTLRRGNRGPEVRDLRQQLADQGYLNPGGVDSQFGGGTETAIKKFQRDQGLEPDGVAWPQTQKRLQHEYGPWEVTRPLTRTADGQRTRTCVDCGHQESEAIKAEPAYHRQDRGEGVRMVQTMLNDLGYSAGTADGIYGGRLDTAFTAFAQDNQLDFEPGSVVPAELDALMSRWIADQSGKSWMGMGDRNSPVQLTLTVTPKDTEGEIRTFTWSLSNLGNRRCTFNALLLGFGSAHSFDQDDSLVLVLDNAGLTANGGNTLTGTFTASTEWDARAAGSFRFCALATQDATGDRWLSNPVIVTE